MRAHSRGWGEMRPAGGGSPLRTVTELAEILGVSRQALGRALKNDPDAPKCKRSNRNSCAASRSDWYEPREVVRWYRQRAEG